MVLDEPVSALDVSIQAQVVNLLDAAPEAVRAHVPLHRPRPLGRAPRLRPRRGDVPRQDRRGRARASRSTTRRCTRTRRRCSRPCRSSPRPSAASGTRIVLEGDVPSPANPPSGCRFRTRCWKAQEICAEEEPALVPRAGGGAPGRLPLRRDAEPARSRDRRESPGAYAAKRAADARRREIARMSANSFRSVTSQAS